MASDEEATKAVEMFNGKELDGRTVTVNEARPMEARPRGGFGGGNRY
jgi:RNA recognition motif-containing protein